jgi:ribosomal protein S1
VAKKYKVGDIVSGKVTKTVPFGAFVRLPEGVEGLIHVSETTGPLDEGDKVKAVVINLEPEKQKLGLSIKQLGKGSRN